MINLLNFFEYCKLIFDLNWDTKEIVTKVFECESTDNEEDEGTEVETKTLSQMEKYVGWGCYVRMILRFNKLWAAKTPDNDDKCGYGVTMKILQMQVVPRSISSSKEQFKKNRFGSKYRDDSGSDTEEEPEPEEEQEGTDVTKDEESDSDNEDTKENEDSDDSDSEEEEEEEERSSKRRRKRRKHN